MSFGTRLLARTHLLVPKLPFPSLLSANLYSMAFDLITLLLVLLTAAGGYVFSRLKSDELKEE